MVLHLSGAAESRCRSDRRLGVSNGLLPFAADDSAFDALLITFDGGRAYMRVFPPALDLDGWPIIAGIKQPWQTEPR
jgi:hypothetical protein